MYGQNRHASIMPNIPGCTTSSNRASLNFISLEFEMYSLDICMRRSTRCQQRIEGREVELYNLKSVRQTDSGSSMLRIRAIFNRIFFLVPFFFVCSSHFHSLYPIHFINILQSLQSAGAICAQHYTSSGIEQCYVVHRSASIRVRSNMFDDTITIFVFFFFCFFFILFLTGYLHRRYGTLGW